MNRGSGAGEYPDRSLVLASMRPRFMNRGSCADSEIVKGYVDAASMRPRFMNRGSGELPDDDWSPEQMLQ